MKSRLFVLLALALSLAVAAVTGASAGDRPRGDHRGHGDRGHGVSDRLDLPDRLELPAGWQPEGIAAGRRFDLYVGSIPTGAVLRVNALTGATRTVVPAREGRAAIGLKYDRRGRLWVAGGPTGDGFVYDARTGEDLGAFQLAPEGGPTFVNDVALTRRAGYFTDSRRPVIYAVNANLRGSRTIELTGFPMVEGNNLNGIVATPREDALISVQGGDVGKLWKIDPATGAFVQIDLGGATVLRGDGLLLKGRTLYVMRNRDEIVSVVRLNADYTAGKIVTEIHPNPADVDVPTTITFLKGELYAVNARFGTTDPQPAPYWISLIRR